MYVDRKISPGILLDRKNLFPRLRQRCERPAFLLKCQEDFFFLLASHKKFFQCLLIQFPLSHIVVKRLDPLVLILQDFIKIP